MIRAGDGEPVVEAMRWGFPADSSAGAYHVTNVRNVASGFSKPWLKVAQRYIVPVAQFAEPDPEKPKPRTELWFARPYGVVAPIHPKAMPVVLSPTEAHAWLTAPPAQVLKLQKPLADEALLLLARE